MIIDWYEILYVLMVAIGVIIIYLPEIGFHLFSRFHEKHSLIFAKYKFVRLVLAKISQNILAILFVWIGASFFIQYIDPIPLHESEDWIYEALAYLFILYWGYKMIPTNKCK